MHARTQAAPIILAAGLLLSGFVYAGIAEAAASPELGAAASYAILADTYAVPAPGTTVSGDIGFTIAPTITPSGVHAQYGSGGSYIAAKADIATALSSLNAEACTFTFAAGAVDLATDATHGTLGVYTPGVYCVPSMAPSVTIGAAGITLSGSGTYIFRFNRSLVTAIGSTVVLADGASACDVFWTPLDNAITSSLGDDSTFSGTLIGNTRLQVKNNVHWTGRAFVPAGVVETLVDDVITVPSSCAIPPEEPPVVIDPPIVVATTTPPVVTETPTTTPPTVTVMDPPGAPNTGNGPMALYGFSLSALLALIALGMAAYERRMLRTNR